MIAYNKEWLENNNALTQIDNAFAENCLSPAEKVAAASQYPSGFYTPNIFIRIGLIILSIIIISFSFGLLALLFLTSGNESEKSVSILCILFGIACYAALEWFVKTKNHYQSGVDDALLWMGPGFVLAGLNFGNTISSLSNAILILVLAIFLMLRFADRLMAVVAFVALLAVIFFSVVHMGNVAKNILPFILMVASAIIYFISKKMITIPSCKNYQKCFEVTSIAGLVSFYLSGNYHVVREANNEFFNLQPGVNLSIPFGWIFWIFTIAIPLLYIFRGILKKDSILLRTGLLLVTGTVFSLRYYYHLVPIETPMIIGGLLIIAIAYALIKYLKETKAGFTSEAKMYSNSETNIEALLIAETLSGQQPQQTGTEFGGGSFGGGGTSGDF